MGFIGDIASKVAGPFGDVAGKIGNQFGFGGGANQFQAKAPVNTFQAQAAPISDPGYMQAIQQAMAGQQGLVGQLQGQAAGTGPSLAQPLLQQATDQNSNLAAGAIGSIRGMNPGLAARQILQQRAQNQQQSAQQAATLRAQEQLGAQGLLGNVLQGQLGTATAGNTALQGLGVRQNLGVQGINANVAAGNQAADLSAQGINAGVAQQNADISSRAWGGLLGGMSGIAGLAAGGGGGGGASAAGVDSAWQGINEAGGLPLAGLGIAGGGQIPGNAPVAGDSPRNDKVPGMLSPGEIVLPRSIAQAADAPEKAAEFVRAIRRKHYAKGGEVKGGDAHYGHVLKHLRESNDRLSRIEQHLADGGEVKPAPSGDAASSFVDALKRLVSHTAGGSSPSVFDAKSAVDTHKKRLQEALEGAK